MTYTHLLYVRKYSIFSDKYELFVYGVSTNDIFHTIGEFYFRCFEKIESIAYVELTDKNRQAKFDFLKKHNLKIHFFQDEIKK